MLGAARPSFALPTPSELSEYDAAFEATRDAPDALSGARLGVGPGGQRHWHEQPRSAQIRPR